MKGTYKAQPVCIKWIKMHSNGEKWKKLKCELKSIL